MWNNIKILGKYSVTGYLGILEKGRIIYVDGKTEERDLQDENKIREAKPHNIL